MRVYKETDIVAWIERNMKRTVGTEHYAFRKMLLHLKDIQVYDVSDKNEGNDNDA